MIRNICIYGVGGVGGYFGANMIHNDVNKAYNISFVARGEHLRAIQNEGLTLKGDTQTITVHPKLAAEAFWELAKPDLILLCIKAYDLVPAIESIQEVLEEDTILLPLLNGVDIYERIRKITDKGIVLPACVYVGTHIECPGVIKQKGGNGRILFGNDRTKGAIGCEAVKQVLDTLGISYEYKPNMDLEIWQKYLFISAYGMVTAATDHTLGQVFEAENLRGDVEKIMQEITQIGKARGVEFTQAMLETALGKAGQFPYETKTSFQRDFENRHKKNEKELFTDTIIAMGMVVKIPTPTVDRYAVLLNTI